MNAGDMYPLFAGMLTNRPWDEVNADTEHAVALCGQILLLEAKHKLSCDITKKDLRPSTQHRTAKVLSKGLLSQDLHGLPIHV